MLPLVLPVLSLIPFETNITDMYTVCIPGGECKTLSMTEQRLYGFLITPMDSETVA